MVWVGSTPRAVATSPNWRSRSTMTTSPGNRSPRATARFTATVVFPAPPLAASTGITRLRGRWLPVPPGPFDARRRAASSARSMV